jgi:MFS family permease
MANQEVPQSAGAGPRFFYGYVIVLVAFIIVAVAEGLLYSFGVFFEPLLSEFGWTRAMTAGALSLAGLLVPPIGIVAGKLTDRFGPRQVLTACGFFFGLGYILMSQTSTLWQLYLFYGVMVGIGTGLYWISVVSIVPKWFVHRRALMMGTVLCGISIGQLIFPPVTNWLISAYDWRASYLIIGSISMGIIVTSAQFLRRHPHQLGVLTYGETRQEGPIIETREYSLREAIRSRQFWIFCAMLNFYHFCVSIVYAHIVIHAIGLGMSSASAANTLAIVGIGGIIGRLGFGRLADLIGLKPILIVSFTLLSIDFLWLLTAGEMWMLYLFAAIFGIAYGAFGVLESPTIANLFGLSSLGVILGASLAIGEIGFVLGAVAAGYIFDVIGSYQMAFLICAVTGAIAAVLSTFLTLTKAS